MTSFRSLLVDLRRVGSFTPVASYQRLAYACGALLVLSGLVHVGVFLVDGGSWTGPLAWRKPVVFGLSFGITLLTVAWITGLLRPKAWAGWALLGTLSIASVVEVSLITMQRWRGVPSHFNESTPFDGMVFSLMGLMVSLVGVVIVAVTIWSFVRIEAPPSLTLAVRAGLVLLLVSQAVGAHMIAVGGNTFGPAGVMKLPHAVTLHAVQVLPGLALLLLVSETAERHRVRMVATAATGYLLLVAATLTQTYAGLSPLEPATVPAALAAAGLVVLGWAVVLTLTGLVGRTRGPSAPAVGT